MDSLPKDLQIVIDRNTRITKNTSSTGDYRWKLIAFRDQFVGMTLSNLRDSEIIDFEPETCFEYDDDRDTYQKIGLSDPLRSDRGYWIKMSGEISDKNILTGDTSNLMGIHPNIHGVASRKLKGDVANITGDISDLTGTIHSGLIGNVSNLHGDITPFTGNISDDLTGNLSNLKNNILQITHVGFAYKKTEEIKKLYLDISGYKGNIDSIYRRLNVNRMRKDNLYGIIPWNITGIFGGSIYGDISYLLPKIFQGSLPQNSDLYLEYNDTPEIWMPIKLDEETPILRRLIGEPSPNISGYIKQGYSGDISYLLPKIFQGTGLHNDIKFICSEDTNNYHITESSEILRKLDGNVSGLTGIIADSLMGTISSGLTGTISSDLLGNISEDLTGTISEDLKGEISPRLTGEISSGLTGDISPELTGNISGLTGYITQLVGDISSELDGNMSFMISKIFQGNVNYLNKNIAFDITNFKGNITKESKNLRMLKGTISDLKGTISSLLTGDISGLTGEISPGLTGTISSGLTGEISPELTGTISENLTGDISLLISKIFQGNVDKFGKKITFDITNFKGNITKDSENLRPLLGNISEDLTGTISSGLTGTISWELTGIISPMLEGTISPMLEGTISSDLTGTITGLEGTISSELTGDISLLISKIFQGTNNSSDDIIWDISGLIGDITKDSENLRPLTGTISSGLTGTISSLLTGVISEDLTGGISSDLTGTISPELTGTI